MLSFSLPNLLDWSLAWCERPVPCMLKVTEGEDTGGDATAGVNWAASKRNCLLSRLELAYRGNDVVRLVAKLRLPRPQVPVVMQEVLGRPSRQP